MEVYASVDQRTRHKLEEMLQTWKEPVPGSIDTTPVFPLGVVRPIENALIKARTSALQAQQQQERNQMRSRGARPPPGAQYRATPTPPNARQPFSQPPLPAANGRGPGPAFGQQPYPQPQVSSPASPASQLDTSADGLSRSFRIPQRHRNPRLQPPALRPIHYPRDTMALRLLSLE